MASDPFHMVEMNWSTGNNAMSDRLRKRRLLGCLALAFLLLLPAAASEAGLPAPSGPVILRVLGDIENANQGEAAAFDRDMLEALGMETLVTQTAWTEGEVIFEGVRGSRLLEALGDHGDQILAKAINDYSVEIPAADFETNDLFIALKMNGRYMRVRDKGPIWIIYPFSERPELDVGTYRNRSIWQLEQLEFR